MSHLPIVTRFAPSPTGRLHLGHVYSALFAFEAARADGGRFLVRLEDIDPVRCRPELAGDILADLAWLGLRWEEPVRRQSEHMDDYRAALSALEARGLLYPCFCTRRDIQEEVARAGHAPQGPDGPRYPGICRRLSRAEAEERQARGEPYALRLDMEAAMRQVPALAFVDLGVGRVSADPGPFGDVVLARKDVPTSYHLSVTVDDALQGVTLVTRGVDLLPATHLHRLLQALLELPTPTWHHHSLLTDASGKRLAKRDGAESIASLRARGLTPEEVKALIPGAAERSVQTGRMEP